MIPEDLRRHLRQSRDALDGLGEYDARRPLVPSGTNVLGPTVDGAAGRDHDDMGDAGWWAAYVAATQAAADPFRP